MSPPYSNGSRFFASHSRPHDSYRDSESTSLLDDVGALLVECSRQLSGFWKKHGRRMVSVAMLSAARWVRQNLVLRRLFSFPHLLVAFWILLLLWGERWVFHAKVTNCHWDDWEKWVRQRQIAPSHSCASD
jgi:ethanolamine phosphate phosphodiesterase